MSLRRTFDRWSVEVDVQWLAHHAGPRGGNASAKGVFLPRLLEAEGAPGFGLGAFVGTFFTHVRQLAAGLGITLPDVAGALRRMDMDRVETCAMRAVLEHFEVMTMMECGIQFATMAMDALRDMLSGHSKTPGRREEG